MEMLNVHGFVGGAVGFAGCYELLDHGHGVGQAFDIEGRQLREIHID